MSDTIVSENFFEIYNGTDIGSVDSAAAVDGNDNIFVLDSNDDLSSADKVDGGNAADTLEDGDGADLIVAGAGNDLIDSGAVNDVLSGSDGADSIVAGTGKDSFDAGSGNDTVFSGNSNDSVVAGSVDNLIVEGDGAGDDPWTLCVDPQIISIDTLDVMPTETLQLNLNIDEISLRHLALVFPDSRAVSDSDFIVSEDAGGQSGGSHNSIFDGSGNDTLNGGNAADTLEGSDGADSIVAGAGNDSIDGFAGNDFLGEGSANKTMYSGDGNNSVVAELADQLIIGCDGVGDDTYIGDVAAYFTSTTDAAGDMAFFHVADKGNFYLLNADETAGVTPNDALVQLTGVMSITSIDLTSVNLALTA